MAPLLAVAPGPPNRGQIPASTSTVEPPREGFWAKLGYVDDPGERGLPQVEERVRRGSGANPDARPERAECSRVYGLWSIAPAGPEDASGGSGRAQERSCKDELVQRSSRG